jgi:hypothetical protein
MAKRFTAKNHSHGKVERLPAELRQAVENQLAQGATYTEITQYLSKMGEQVSVSAVGRYAAPYIKQLDALRAARQYAKMITEDNPDRPSTEIHEAANAIATQQLMACLLDENTSDKDRARLMNIVANLQKAQVSNEKIKIDSRKAREEMKVAMDALKVKVFEEIGAEHPELAEAIMKIADNIARDKQADK